MARYPTLDELAATDAEKQAAKTAASAPGSGSAIGGGIGTVLGGAAGFLPLLAGPAGAALLPTTIPLAAGLGGSLGSLVGGGIGNSMADTADQQLQAAELERAQKLEALKERQQALADLQALK